VCDHNSVNSILASDTLPLIQLHSRAERRDAPHCFYRPFEPWGFPRVYLFIIIGKSPIFCLGESVDDLKVLNPTAGESVGSVGLRGERNYDIC
jgi:hypothetical protein